MQNLLNALGHNIKKIKENHYKARCPVHGDKDFAMYIKQEGGKILAHCFACGANGYDLYTHLGLPLSELCGDSQRPTVSSRTKSEHLEDMAMITIYESDVKKGFKPGYYDEKRYRLAKERVKHSKKLLEQTG